LNLNTHNIYNLGHIKYNKGEERGLARKGHGNVVNEMHNYRPKGR